MEKHKAETRNREWDWQLGLLLTYSSQGIPTYMPGEKHYSEGKVKVPKVKVVWNAQGKARK